MGLFWTIFLLLGAEPVTTGSAVCGNCHAAISSSYAKTAMALSSGMPRQSVLERFDRASFFDPHSDTSYSVKREGDGYVLNFSKKDGSLRERRSLAYFVGSGARARSYLLESGGFLYEAPVTYYSGAFKWDLSPGYQRYSSPFLTRAIAPGCLKCHASGVQAIAGTQNQYQTPAFLESGVSCERCHGAGGNHVAKMNAGKATGSFEIANPARLEPAKRDAICAQCHLNGEVRVPRPGREQADFEAGDSLSDYLVAFVRRSDSPQMKVTSHVENLAQSTCKQRSGDKMWCGTCHNAHAVPAVEEKAAWYRAKCLTCHANDDCKDHSAARQANKNDCTACHMPQNAVTDADHVVYTDHSIRRRRATPAVPLRDAELLPFGGGPASARDLGLAYAIVALRENNAAYRERAFALLREAERTQPEDTQTLSYLADLYRGRSDDASAAHFYERLARVDRTQVSALAALGAYAMEQGHDEEAIRWWRDALARNPALVLVRLNLAVVLVRTGQRREARTVLLKALEFSPGMPAVKKLLSQIQ